METTLRRVLLLTCCVTLVVAVTLTSVPAGAANNGHAERQNGAQLKQAVKEFLDRQTTGLSGTSKFPYQILMLD